MILPNTRLYIIETNFVFYRWLTIQLSFTVIYKLYKNFSHKDTDIAVNNYVFPFNLDKKEELHMPHNSCKLSCLL